MPKKITKYRNYILLSLLILQIIANVTLFSVFRNNELSNVPHDADRKSNGNYLICTTTFKEMFAHIGRTSEQTSLEINSSSHKIVEIDDKGNVIWEITGMGIPHEVCELPNGELLVADTSNDRIIQINYPNKDIVWSWEPKLINWTQLNPSWDVNHYYNNPITYDFTHMNDVEFKQYGSYNACLISIRNFDLIVEINYTAEMIGPANNPANILWWFGDHKNHTLLYEQHNPDYLPNGNILIADSQNNRIIEVNKSTKEIVWEYGDKILWPRDADLLPNGNILITDCFNNRIIELNPLTNDVVWSYGKDIIIPYEADYLPNGNILISGAYSGIVVEVDREGNIVWSYGNSIEKFTFLINAGFFTLIAINGICYRVIKLRHNLLTKREKSWQITILILVSLLLIISLITLIAYSFILRNITRLSYVLIGKDMF